MKNFIIFTVIICLIMTGSKMMASEDIYVHQTFSNDTTFNPFPPPEVIYSLRITGNVDMLSSRSLVRVLVTTDKGEFMIFEAYPLISTDSVFDFRDICDETCFLDGVIPDVIRLEIIDASIKLDYITYDKEFVQDATTLQYEEKKKKDFEKIDLMNKKIADLGMDWISGNTSLVDLYYQEKKAIYHEKYNLLGYDYYKGGIYQVIGQTYEPFTYFSLVDQWDWRNRHSANVPGTPYFDGDDENFTGWLTIPKDQNVPNYCGACGIFGSTGALESVINLYYNQHLDLDLSEQHLLACVPNAICGNVDPHLVREYLKDSGVVTEACSPYLGVNEEGDCEDPDIVCTSPDTKVRITSYTEFQGSPASDWEDIFAEMVLNGPISLTINSGTHYVTLIGWHYDDVSEELYIIFKDSYGPDNEFGINGFVIQQVSGNYRDAASQHIPYFDIIPVQPIVEVRDADGDGYCWWGIGPKPQGYENCPSQRDCDDSNPFKGPYSDLEDYSCDCDDSFTFGDTIKITTNVTWQGIVKLDKVLTIENGGQLTITGTVYVPWMWSADLIIVKKGGRLIIDGGKITKSCDELWKGIQVWGDSSLSQYPYSNQGYLNIINNGTIEYAKTAVYVGRNVSETPYYGYSGGIVTCENAIFLNNEIDVEFLPFRNDHPYGGNEIENFSGFRTSTFKMYDPEFVLPKPIAHVILDGVNGVDFYACTFETEEVPNYPIDENDRGIGILAYDAQVSVKGKCTSATIPCISYDSCYFRHLRYGIKAFNSGGNKYFAVSEGAFKGNVAGIYISGYHTPDIVSSYFYSNIGSVTVQGLTEKFIGGIYLDEVTGYHIEGNHFDGPYAYIGEIQVPIARIGIYVDNSGETDNEIYNNLFTGLDAGIVAEGVNKGGEELRTGLCLKCNDFLHCENDIMVFPDPLYPRGRNMGIKTDQGSNSTQSSALAGNTFTSEIQDYQGYDGTGNQKYFWSYYNDAEYINYYHHANITPIILYPTVGNYTSQTISLINKETQYFKNQACPSSLNNNNNHLKSLEDSRCEIAFANLQLDTLLNDYYALVDGGSTESLNFEIVTSMPVEALELRQELLSGSPYLSDTVMKNAILKENVLPNAMIRDVMTANPQSAKSFDLIETVENRLDPMPDYMMAEIMEGKEQLGAKEAMESTISYWEQYRARAIRQLIREYLTDSTIINRNDSLIQLFDNQTDLESKYRLAFTYWDALQEEQAIATLNNIPASFILSSRQEQAHDAYIDFFAILESMKDSCLHASQLDTSTVQQLITMMNENLPGVSVYARGLLVKGRHIDFTETVSFPTEVKSYPSYIQDYKNNKFSENEKLHLFPNPTSDYVVAYFNTIELGDKGKIIINDLQGRNLENILLKSEQNQHVIDLTNYPNGIYLINLYVNDKLVSTEKLSKGLK